LSLQVKSESARKDPDLKSSFEKCYQETILKQASKIKELIDEDYLHEKKTSLASFGGSARSELHTLGERFGVIGEAAAYQLNLEIAEGHRTQCSTNALKIEREVNGEVEKLRGDHETAIADFEKRFEKVMAKAVKLANFIN
jgi:hypothetical protein